MTSDNERREVARRLRGIDAERLDRVYGMDGEGGECSDPDMAKAGRNLMLGAIAEAVGLHYAPYYFDAAPLRDRLADLIEPEPERTCRVESSHEECGDGCYSYFEYELTCGHGIAWDDQLPPNYCPECGRRVLYDSNDYI